MTICDPPIRLKASGSKIQVSSAELEKMRRDFRSHFVALPGLLDESLTAQLLALVDSVKFCEPPANHSRATINGLLAGNQLADTRLSFLFNDDGFFDFIRAIAGCPPIRAFGGRLIRLLPGVGHYIRWHSDGPDHYYSEPEFKSHDDVSARVCALRLNLSRRPYQGAELQFKAQDGTIRECSDKTPGSVVLFDPLKVHGNAELEGDLPKTTFVGWFYRFNEGESVPLLKAIKNPA